MRGARWFAAFVKAKESPEGAEDETNIQTFGEKPLKTPENTNIVFLKTLKTMAKPGMATDASR